MATIRETLKQLAADTLPDYTYLFEDWDTADSKLEKLSYPAIVASSQPAARRRYATAGYTIP